MSIEEVWIGYIVGWSLATYWLELGAAWGREAEIASLTPKKSHK